MSFIPKPSVLTATAQIVPNILKPAAPAFLQKQSFVLPKAKAGFLKLPNSAISASNSLAASHNVRMAHTHTDIQTPDFSYYRKEGMKDATKSKDPAATGSKAFTYLITGVGSLAGVYTGKILVNDLLGALSASADVLALAKIEVELDDIPEGKTVLMKWRGKPLFVRHRTAEDIETEKSVNLTELRDPQHDSDRVQKDEWLIVLGICTHLGCVPLADTGAYGGFYCPCHGSHYDRSGRIRKGPAPLNLEVPYHQFAEDNILVVG